MFGFLRRSRDRKPVEDKPVVVKQPPAAPAGAPPAAPAGAPPADEPREERPGKSWFSSSLDLHQGLEISDVDDVTEPMPLPDPKPEPKPKR